MPTHTYVAYYYAKNTEVYQFWLTVYREPHKINWTTSQLFIAWTMCVLISPAQTENYLISKMILAANDIMLVSLQLSLVEMCVGVYNYNKL